MELIEDCSESCHLMSQRVGVFFPFYLTNTVRAFGLQIGGVAEAEKCNET